MILFIYNSKKKIINNYLIYIFIIYLSKIKILIEINIRINKTKKKNIKIYHSKFENCIILKCYEITLFEVQFFKT